MVQPWTDLYSGRVCGPIRCTRMSETSALPVRSAGKSRRWPHDRPHTDALQFRILRFTRLRQQVSDGMIGSLLYDRE